MDFSHARGSQPRFILSINPDVVRLALALPPAVPEYLHEIPTTEACIS